MALVSEIKFEVLQPRHSDFRKSDDTGVRMHFKVICGWFLEM
jgi:hypothetical protein